MRKTRILGQGLEVSAIGLGCMGMDHAYGAPADREEMIKLIRHAVTLGCNIFPALDTHKQTFIIFAFIKNRDIKKLKLFDYNSRIIFN